MKTLLFFFLGICAITLHFTLMLGADAIHYFSLKTRAKAEIAEWEIVEIEGRYALKAAYSFQTENKPCQGSFTLEPPYYLNEHAAFSALKEKAKKSWPAWYNPKKPEVSALQKSFPFNLLIRTLICYGVLAYFILLRRRIAFVETA